MGNRGLKYDIGLSIFLQKSAIVCLGTIKRFLGHQVWECLKDSPIQLKFNPRKLVRRCQCSWDITFVHFHVGDKRVVSNFSKSQVFFVERVLVTPCLHLQCMIGCAK